MDFGFIEVSAFGITIVFIALIYVFMVGANAE